MSRSSGYIALCTLRRLRRSLLPLLELMRPTHPLRLAASPSGQARLCGLSGRALSLVRVSRLTNEGIHTHRLRVPLPLSSTAAILPRHPPKTLARSRRPPAAHRRSTTTRLLHTNPQPHCFSLPRRSNP